VKTDYDTENRTYEIQKPKTNQTTEKTEISVRFGMIRFGFRFMVKKCPHLPEAVVTAKRPIFYLDYMKIVFMKIIENQREHIISQVVAIEGIHHLLDPKHYRSLHLSPCIIHIILIFFLQLDSLHNQIIKRVCQKKTKTNIHKVARAVTTAAQLLSWRFLLKRSSHYSEFLMAIAPESNGQCSGACLWSSAIVASLLALLQSCSSYCSD
jgi:hypothetical protein